MDAPLGKLESVFPPHSPRTNEFTKERKLDSLEEIVATAPVIEHLMSYSIPEIAKGYEDIYRRFIGGKLIYRPHPKSDIGKIELPFAALGDQLLEGEFDLSECGNTSQHISINTGYRKGKIAKNTNKVEIWICPRFLIERNLGKSASHFKDIMSDWSATKSPVGIFWTWGGWDDLKYYNYLITNSMKLDMKICLKNTSRRHCPSRRSANYQNVGVPVFSRYVLTKLRGASINWSYNVR